VLHNHVLPIIVICLFGWHDRVWCLLLKKSTCWQKGHLARLRQCFHDTSKGQGDPLGIFLDKTGFWTLIKGEEG
jgi:hypothetical protein